MSFRRFFHLSDKINKKSIIGLLSILLLISAITISIKLIDNTETTEDYSSGSSSDIDTGLISDNDEPHSSKANQQIYWVSNRGDNNNPGTEDKPFKTIQKGANHAKAGDIVKIEPGIYDESVSVFNSGEPNAPIIFESTVRHGAVMAGKANHFSSSGQGNYIVIRGIWFKYSPLQNSMYTSQVITPSTGWRIEDCRFTNCAVGIGYPGHIGTSNIEVIRCIFEDMGVTGSWAWADENNFMENHLIKDTIIRRTNTYNHDPGYGAMGMKYGFTKNLVADGVISYDNNGIGFWLDYNNIDFTVKNSTFFGNHAGMAHRNFTDGGLSDQSWAGIGLSIEVSQSGVIKNNVSYSNLHAGLSIWESGNGGGIIVEDNIIVDNAYHIELRALEREATQQLSDVTIRNNSFKDWKRAVWLTTNIDTIRNHKTPVDARIFIDDNNYTHASNNILFGRWINTFAYGIDEIQDKLNAEHNGYSADFDFNAPYIDVYKTTLDDVGTDKMWQVHSKEAESNHIDKAIEGQIVGDTVIIPVTGRKEIFEKDGKWYTEVYDLQARYVTLVMNEQQKEWLELNVNPFASITQTDVKIKLTKLEPYRVEAQADY